MSMSLWYWRRYKMKIKKSAKMSIKLVTVILFATKTIQNAHCIKALSYRQALEQICSFHKVVRCEC